MAAAKRRRRKAPKTNEPKPAPGDLALVQELVNTMGLDGGPDALATPGEVERWLRRRGLLHAGVELGESERRRFAEVRAGLRALILDSSGHADAGVLRRLEREVTGARFGLRFDDDGRPVGYEAASGRFDDALGALVAVALAARAEGLWPSLKLCARDGCRRAFFDTSPSGTGRWCTPRCGYRVRAAAYRRSGKHWSL